MTKRFPLSLCVAALVLGIAASASAQITITSPTNGQRLKAGPDFATDVLGDPWDMSNPQDISSDPNDSEGFAGGVQFSGGKAGGTTIPFNGTVSTTFALIYRGFYGVPNPGKNGLNYPMNPNVYRKLSFKMFSGQAGENMRVYWFHRPFGDPAGWGLGAKFLANTVGGNQIWVDDLTTNNVTSPPYEPFTSGNVLALRIDPNSFTTGQQVLFDWVRVTAADNAPGASMHTITWTGASTNIKIDVVDAEGTVMNVVTGLNGTSYSWNYGVLPPGNYQMRIASGAGTPATRNFSINNPPIVQVTDPNLEGGGDYATEVLHNPWDMADPADVALPMNVHNTSFSGGFFNATSDACPGCDSGDPGAFMVTRDDPPIDTQRYRYLSFDLQVDRTFDQALGSVGRFFWTPEDLADANSMTTSKAFLVWQGLNHYVLDLGAPTTTIEPLGGVRTQRPWLSVPTMKYFRLDPHEFPFETTFHLGNVRLAAMDEAAPTFTIRWAGADADGDSVTVSLFYDTNTDPNDGMTQIATGLPLAAGAYNWNAAAVPSGTYYIYLRATDGIQNFGSYSTGQIAVTGTAGSNGQMNVEAPGNGGTVSGSFTVSGWAVDLGAPTGTGVDTVQVFAYPNPGSGAAPIALGTASYGVARPDIGAAFGSQFTNSGFTLTAAALPAGPYQLVVYAHSTVTGAFSLTQSLMIQSAAVSQPAMALDSPQPNSNAIYPLSISGWAVDLGAPPGSTGVDAIHVWAFPNPGSGAAPVFVGVASYGIARGDIAAVFGAQFQNSGYALTANSLAPGTYLIVVYAHSSVTGTFNNAATAVVKVAAPVMGVGAPLNGATVGRIFTVAGWAIDRAAPSGAGVDAVHIWAINVATGAAQFVVAPFFGDARPDVAAIYGSQFTNCGFSVSVRSLAPGTYDLIVYAHSAYTGTFNNWTVVRVTVQ